MENLHDERNSFWRQSNGKCDFVWRVPVKSGQKNYFKSVKFMINGIDYDVFIRCIPQQNKPWNHAIYLRRHARSSKDVVIRFSFCVLDEGGDSVESTRLEYERVWETKKGYGWGWDEFVSLSSSFVDDLLDSDGNLSIAVSVNVLKDDQPRELQCQT